MSAMDLLGNVVAQEGCDRCSCGCKYWEQDRCIDCGTRVTDPSVERAAPRREALTDAQARMLREVRRDGQRVYNGRATRTVRRLCALGLVTAELDYVARSGGGAQYAARWTVRPVGGVAPSRGRSYVSSRH